MAHSRVERWCEHEPHASFINAPRNAFRRKLNLHATGFKDIRRACRAGRCTVSVLGYLHSGRRQDKGRCGGDVEGVEAIASRADNVHGVAIELENEERGVAIVRLVGVGHPETVVRQDDLRATVPVTVVLRPGRVLLRGDRRSEAHENPSE